MKTGFILLAWALFMIVPHPSVYGADSGWEEYHLEKINAVADTPSSEELRMLAFLSANGSDDSHVKVVRERAWKRLTSIPNFADLFIRNLQEQREKWISGKQAWTVYDGERWWILEPMGKLKHPEIVRVMGNLLSDLEVPGDDGTLQVRSIPPNGVLAARALGELVESPPLGKHWESYTVDDVATWQLWFEQVKAGSRTFRFKGDPQEYNLQGSVSKAVVPARKDPVNGNDRSISDSKQEEKGPVSIAVLIAACGALGWAAFAVLKERRRKTA